MAALRVLQKSLEEAQKSLNVTDDTIRKVTGRDPNESRQSRIAASSVGGRPRDSRLRSSEELYDPPSKRRRESIGFSGRKQDHLSDEENDDSDKTKLSSSVQVTEVPPRPHGDIIPEDTKKKGKDRNRRMLGVLMGTLHQFKKEQDAIQQTGKDRRRVEIEQKLEREAQQEKDKAAQARKSLFQQRRSQQDEVTRLQKKLMIAEMVTEWEEHDKLLSNFIRTNTTPAIYYMPAHHNVHTIKCLQDSKQVLEDKIQAREKEILAESVSMETTESIVKSQVVVPPNKDIFDSEGKVSSRVCEVHPLPRDTEQPVVSMEISKDKLEGSDNLSRD